MKKILVATNNPAKLARYRRLLRAADIELVSPADEGIEAVEIEESGTTLTENARIKARTYFGKTELPILGNDTGFWVAGEGMVDAPKRIALDGRSEHELSKEETAKAVLEFWKGAARKHGGKVDAAWPEVFVLVLPDGSERVAESRREILLTDTELGEPHMDFPLRSLYYSKSSGKPAIQHTPEEESTELAPVREALLSILVQSPPWETKRTG